MLYNCSNSGKTDEDVSKVHHEVTFFSKTRNDVKVNQPCEEPRLDISKCKHSSKHWSYHKIAFNSQKAKIWAKVKSFDQFHEN